MATYRILTPVTTVLSDGTELGHGEFSSAQLNGKTIKAGSGVVRAKDVATGRTYSFSSRQPITGTVRVCYE